LAAIPCAGEGACYRTLRDIFHHYFHPPSDWETGHILGPSSRRPSKLASGPPIGAEDPRTGARDRHRFNYKAVS
jgi:hypothetical protein